MSKILKLQERRQDEEFSLCFTSPTRMWKGKTCTQGKERPAGEKFDDQGMEMDVDE